MSGVLVHGVVQAAYLLEIVGGDEVSPVLAFGGDDSTAGDKGFHGGASGGEDEIVFWEDDFGAGGLFADEFIDEVQFDTAALTSLTDVIEVTSGAGGPIVEESAGRFFWKAANLFEAFEIDKVGDPLELAGFEAHLIGHPRNDIVGVSNVAVDPRVRRREFSPLARPVAHVKGWAIRKGEKGCDGLEVVLTMNDVGLPRAFRWVAEDGDFSLFEIPG